VARRPPRTRRAPARRGTGAAVPGPSGSRNTVRPVPGAERDGCPSGPSPGAPVPVRCAREGGPRHRQIAATTQGGPPRRHPGPHQTVRTVPSSVPCRDTDRNPVGPLRAVVPSPPFPPGARCTTRAGHSSHLPLTRLAMPASPSVPARSTPPVRGTRRPRSHSRSRRRSTTRRATQTHTYTTRARTRPTRGRREAGRKAASEHPAAVPAEARRTAAVGVAMVFREPMESEGDRTKRRGSVLTCFPQVEA